MASAIRGWRRQVPHADRRFHARSFGFRHYMQRARSTVQCFTLGHDLACCLKNFTITGGHPRGTWWPPGWM